MTTISLTPRSLATLLALASIGLLTATSIATAAPLDQSDCQAVYDTAYDPDRTCDSLERQRKTYIPPRKPQDPPVLKNWRAAIFDQALTSADGSEGSGGGGGGDAGGNR